MQNSARSCVRLRQSSGVFIGHWGRSIRLLEREDEAQHEWKAAREIIKKLAETIDETALREYFVQTALQTIPLEKPQSSRRMTTEKV